MSEPFLGELKLMAFNFPPKGWAFCNGQFLPINQNQALFSLLGTTYGGNGQTTFALPDLRGRVAMHVGGGLIQGQQGGEEAHTISIAEMPTHLHQVTASNANSDQPIPTNNLTGAFNNGYRAPASLIAINPGTVTNVGGSQPHNNMSPYIVMNYCIALIGIFPSRN